MGSFYYNKGKYVPLTNFITLNSFYPTSLNVIKGKIRKTLLFDCFILRLYQKKRKYVFFALLTKANGAVYENRTHNASLEN